MQKALLNLKASLARVRDITADIDTHVQAALADSAIQARHETTLCAASVILSGFLESFLREVAEEMVAEICSQSSGVTSKPASRGHFKTGQLSASRTAIFLPYRQ
jgi:hypothetical protein